MSFRHVRVIRPERGELPPFQRTFESGDAISVDAATFAEEVFLTVDDIDDTEVPTARLTPDEAERVAMALLAASREARRDLPPAVKGS